MVKLEAESERVSLHVINELRIKITVGTAHGQTRAHGGTGNSGADTRNAADPFLIEFLDGFIEINK